MEQEIFSTIQRNQNAPICNDDLFTYEYLDSKQEDICFEDGCLVSTDYLTYLTFENVRFELNQPIKSFEYSNNLLALIYADNSGEVFTLEKKTVKKFQDVYQILMHLDKIYTLEKDYTVKEYLFNLEQSICKESLSSTLEAMSISKENKEVPSNETNKVLFQEKKQIFLTIFKNTLFYFKDNNLYNKEQKKITNSVKKIKELKNDKLLVITEQNNKINLKLTNIYFKLQEEVRIEEDSDKIVEVKLFEDYFVIATFYKIYIFKDNLELIDIKDFNKKIKSIYVHNFRIKILFGEEKKKEKIKKSKNERYFAMPEESGLENNNYKCQVEMLTKIVDKLVNTFNEERKEREDKERKRMESLLEKISEQLNLNLKLIIENSVKKEIQKISFKNLENSLCHFFKEFILENMVPVFENSITEMKIQQKEKCEKCSNNLYESFKRDEVTKGVELALESNEEIFDEFISKFDVAKIEILPINLLIELYKKILMGKNDLCIPTRNKIFKKIKNQKEFLKGLNEDIILLIPSTHLLKLITLIYTDNEYLDLLEEIIRYIDINTLNDHEIKDFSRILDDIEKEWKGTKVGHYCIMQRGFIKRRSKKDK